MIGARTRFALSILSGSHGETWSVLVRSERVTVIKDRFFLLLGDSVARRVSEE